MKEMVSFILSAFLVLTFSYLTTGKIFSQTLPDAHTSDTTTVAVKPDTGSSSDPVKGMTPMRARALAGVVLGLMSLVIGWRARKRAAAGIGNKGRNGAIVALSLGGMALLLSVIHLSITSGAVFGSGSGKAGAIFGLVFALIGITFSGLVLRQKKV